MSLIKIMEKYENVYVYEENNNIKLCNYCIEIEKKTIIICKYEILIKYFDYFKSKNYFDTNNICFLSDDIEDVNICKNVLKILIKEDESSIEKYLKINNNDSNILAKLINLYDFLQATEIATDTIYKYFTDNIEYIYNISNDIFLKNNLYYEVILEKMIKNIYNEIKETGKYVESHSRRGNSYYSYKNAPEWIILLMKIMLTWSKKMDVQSKKRIRKKLGDAINYVKDYEYNLDIKDLITDDIEDCDVIPFNILIKFGIKLY